ncbi:hypothetical protein GGX14DRAFT_406303 [Mycena pura]|uniref:Uncharacterized protein n=1 Tax=Mycena pura TaxID=153505 RepID=A0AAD6UTJ9_9AGAR|nr:hypothetical protein GGX14DRAFT_406303 [Mycena pura]
MVIFVAQFKKIVRNKPKIAQEPSFAWNLEATLYSNYMGGSAAALAADGYARNRFGTPFTSHSENLDFRSERGTRILLFSSLTSDTSRTPGHSYNHATHRANAALRGCGHVTRSLNRASHGVRKSGFVSAAEGDSVLWPLGGAPGALCRDSLDSAGREADGAGTESASSGGAQGMSGRDVGDRGVDVAQARQCQVRERGARLKRSELAATNLKRRDQRSTEDYEASRGSGGPSARM